MTRDELFNEIKVADCETVVDALRAVVELHKPSEGPDEYENIGCEACGFDSEYMQYNQTYPCPTIKAIEKELK
jgi:predicted Zn-ribbon and HTH transcriptional regulator